MHFQFRGGWIVVDHSALLSRLVVGTSFVTCMYSTVLPWYYCYSRDCLVFSCWSRIVRNRCNFIETKSTYFPFWQLYKSKTTTLDTTNLWAGILFTFFFVVIFRWMKIGAQITDTIHVEQINLRDSGFSRSFFSINSIYWLLRQIAGVMR